MRFLRVISSFFYFLFSLNLIFAQSKGGQWQFENEGFDTADWDSKDDSGVLVGNAIYSNFAPLEEGFYHLFLDTLYQYDYFRIEASNDLDFDNENIGISAWLYPIVLNDVHYIINKGRQDSNPKTTNYSIRIALSRNLEFLIRDINNQAQRVSSSFTIPENQWTFIAIYYDFELGKVYMWNNQNSLPVDTLDFTQSFFSNNDPLSIGAWYSANPTTPSVKEFQGRIDEVRISGRLEDILPGYTNIRLSSFNKNNSDIMSINLFPNPVNQSKKQVNFSIQLSNKNYSGLSVKIFNILGQLIFHKESIAFDSDQIFHWNLLDQMGNSINSGVYLVQFECGDYQILKKLLIIN